MSTTKKAARFHMVAVRRESKTKELIEQLSAMLTKRLGVKVKGPDAIHWALVEAVKANGGEV